MPKRDSTKKNALRRRIWLLMGLPVALLVAAAISGVTLRNRPILEQLLWGDFSTGLLLSALLLLGAAFLVNHIRTHRRDEKRAYFGLALMAFFCVVMLTQTVQSGLALLSPIQESQGSILHAEFHTGSKGGGAWIWDVRLQAGKVVRVRTLVQTIDAPSIGRCVLVRYVAHTDFGQIQPCGSRQ